MATKKAYGEAILAMAVALLVLVTPTYAQVPTSTCTSSMITSFTPCMNFLTNSSGAGTSSPTADCCSSLRSLMATGTDCLCQIITAGVPFRIPNRSLAISLPKACNQPGVPIQCKAATAAPLPAPGPTAFGPSGSPAADASLSPSGLIPIATTPSMEPVSDTTPELTPPATTTGSGSTLTPSSAVPSLSLFPSVLLTVAAMLIKCL